MIEYFDNHQYAFWFSLGFVLLAIEALVLGFATGVLIFAGIGALLTGGLLWFEVIPYTWQASIASFGINSTVITAILWKPMQNLQNKNAAPAKDNTSDLVGHTFRLTSAITVTAPGLVRFSGIEWRVEIDDSTKLKQIEAGTKVAVQSVDVGVFRVHPLD